MRRIKRLKAFVCAFAGTALFSACSSEADEIINEAGKGYVSLSVQADAGFQTTRATSEAYEDVNNYTVQILQDDKVVGDTCEWKYSEVPDEIELPNGNYTLKAFYGEDEAVGDEPYVEGSEDFKVESDLKDVEVKCKATSAKVAVTFDEKMDEYFSDYSVSIATKALTKGQTWEKTDSEKVYYLKVNDKETIEMTISLTNQETKKTFESIKSYTISPGDYKNYIIAPKESEDGEGGSLSITINFDDKTNDKPIDIEIPADWK